MWKQKKTTGIYTFTFSLLCETTHGFETKTTPWFSSFTSPTSSPALLCILYISYIKDFHSCVFTISKKILYIAAAFLLHYRIKSVTFSLYELCGFSLLLRTDTTKNTMCNSHYTFNPHTKTISHFPSFLLAVANPVSFYHVRLHIFIFWFCRPLVSFSSCAIIYHTHTPIPVFFFFHITKKINVCFF